LHYAAKQSASVAVVEALLAAYPEAAKKKDADQRLPLHWAATCVAPSKAIVKALLDAYPAAAREKDMGMRTPLHYAAAGEAAWMS
jgi:ankyrin repeat protein